MGKYNFNNLVILDLANNHQGDLQHGINIIRSMAEVVSEFDVKPVLKLQFRQLDTFIHPDYRNKSDIAHIPRFLSTALQTEDYCELIREARAQGMQTACTPFDEQSVDVINQMDIDIIKLASCSATDTPLIEKIISSKKPVIASTGGCTLSQIDQLVHQLSRHDIDHALHHCVSLYPTREEDLQLNQIDILKSRYREVPIGWSTHESPENTSAVQIAAAKGAVFFERHVGLETEQYKLNKYSSTPKQIQKWLKGLANARKSMGSIRRAPSPLEESRALDSLKRGVYARKEIQKGQEIEESDAFFAMPLLGDGLSSGKWREGMIADKKYSKDEVLSKELGDYQLTNAQKIDSILIQVKGMLRDAAVDIGRKSNVELSHHYGLGRFREYGAAIIDVINREYCRDFVLKNSKVFFLQSVSIVHSHSIILVVRFYLN